MSAPSFDDVVAAVRRRVPYLRCEVLDDARAGADGWVRVSTLIEEPDRLEGLVRATGEARGAPDVAVAASLFTQALAFRAPGVAIAAWALGLPSPTLAPAHLAIRLARNRPAELGVFSTELNVHDAPSLAAAVVDGLIGPLAASLRRRLRVGERMLYGNAASSVAGVFRAVQSDGPRGDASVRSRAIALFAAHPRLHASGRWSTVDAGAALGWYWERGNCCLWYRSTEAAGRYCDDCSLERPTTRAERRRAELAIRS